MNDRTHQDAEDLRRQNGPENEELDPSLARALFTLVRSGVDQNVLIQAAFSPKLLTEGGLLEDAEKTGLRSAYRATQEVGIDIVPDTLKFIIEERDKAAAEVLKQFFSKRLADIRTDRKETERGFAKLCAGMIGAAVGAITLPAVASILRNSGADNSGYSREAEKTFAQATQAGVDRAIAKAKEKGVTLDQDTANTIFAAYDQGTAQVLAEKLGQNQAAQLVNRESGAVRALTNQYTSAVPDKHFLGSEALDLGAAMGGGAALGLLLLAAFTRNKGTNAKKREGDGRS